MSESSSCVYVHDKKHGWLPANVVSNDPVKQTATVSITPIDAPEGEEPEKVVKTVKLKDYPNGNLPLQNIDQNGNLITMADMCDLPSLHEAAILYNLKARYEQEDKPYTRTGDIVIAVNPFRWIAELYSPETRELYSEQLVRKSSKDGNARAGLPPHVYEASALAYRGLALDGDDQSILVSGESGAGKTESVKIVMTHLASVRSISGEDDPDDIPEDSGNVVKRVLDSNPLLEAFGNAKTVRNDNSSRFGKYTQLQFDVKKGNDFGDGSGGSCILAGSYCETYLLEKSRVVSHEGAERTYHIFYQVVAAPEEYKTELWGGLTGTTNESFKFIGATEVLLIEGKTDAQNFFRTKDALALIGVVDDTLNSLMRAVCAVLQLGNITFGPDPNNDEGSVITSTEELEKLSDILGNTTEDLNKSLTHRTVIAGKEVYAVPMTDVDAKDSADAFAKEIYHNIFDWLVKTINKATSAEYNYSRANEVEQFGIIGLLDIFGFESFKVNRFEQLCINYTNEKLQQKYIIDIFQSVREEYEYEGIGMVDIPVQDNSDVLALIEGRMGILSVLNEECVRPRGNDNSFVSKVKTMNKESDCLISEKLHRPYEFGVQHYAGAVKYDANGFVQKNNDALPQALLDLAGKSSNEIIKTELLAVAAAKEAAKKKGGRKASAVTISSKFKSQLNVLMQNIAKTRTRYIRCIKPNKEKVPKIMTLLTSVEQLRCAGIVAAVTVSRVAFPNRLMHETVLQRFEFLVEEEGSDGAAQEEKKEAEPGDGKEVVDKLLTRLLKPMETTNDEGAVVQSFVCGKTRAYFKMGALEYLEAQRLKALGVVVTVMQRYVRGFILQLKYAVMKDSAIVAEAFARRMFARNEFLKQKAACLVLSCWVRSYMAKAELVRRRRKRASTLIQSRWRLDRAVLMLRTCRKAAVIMQKTARGSIQRPIYRRLLKEAAEEAKVNSKVQALQRRLAEAEMKFFQAEKQRMEAEKRAAEMATRPAVAGEGVPAAPVAAAATAAPVAPVAPAVPAAPGAPVAAAADGGEGENMTSLQKVLFEESQEMLEVLKKEVFALKAKNYLLRTDLEETKANYYGLSEHNAAVEASFEAFKQHTAHMSKEHMRLMVENKQQKEKLKTASKELTMKKFVLTSEVSKLKEEQRKKDAAATAEIARLKKELQESRKKRGNAMVITAHKLNKHQSSGRSTPTSRGSSNSVFRRTTSMDSLDKWDHDGYWATASADGSLPDRDRPGKFTMANRLDTHDAFGMNTSLSRHARERKKPKTLPKIPPRKAKEQSLREVLQNRKNRGSKYRSWKSSSTSGSTKKKPLASSSLGMAASVSDKPTVNSSLATAASTTDQISPKSSLSMASTTDKPGLGSSLATAKSTTGGKSGSSLASASTAKKKPWTTPSSEKQPVSSLLAAKASASKKPQNKKGPQNAPKKAQPASSLATALPTEPAKKTNSSLGKAVSGSSSLSTASSLAAAASPTSASSKKSDGQK